MAKIAGGFPFTLAQRIDKYREGDDRPYEETEIVTYHEADGREVHDPARIAEIDALIKETSGHEPDDRV